MLLVAVPALASFQRFIRPGMTWSRGTTQMSDGVRTETSNRPLRNPYGCVELCESCRTSPRKEKFSKGGRSGFQGDWGFFLSFQTFKEEQLRLFLFHAVPESGVMSLGRVLAPNNLGLSSGFQKSFVPLVLVTAGGLSAYGEV